MCANGFKHFPFLKRKTSTDALKEIKTKQHPTRKTKYIEIAITIKCLGATKMSSSCSIPPPLEVVILTHLPLLLALMGLSFGQDWAHIHKLFGVFSSYSFRSTSFRVFISSCKFSLLSYVPGRLSLFHQSASYLALKVFETSCCSSDLSSYVWTSFFKYDSWDKPAILFLLKSLSWQALSNNWKEVFTYPEGSGSMEGITNDYFIHWEYLNVPDSPFRTHHSLRNILPSVNFSKIV